MKFNVKQKMTIGLVVFLILLSGGVAAEDEPSQAFDLAEYKGKVVMLDFWASWCGPCRKSFPWLNKIQKTKSKKGFVVIGINVDENSEDAKRFLEEFPAEFKIAYDPKGQFARHYSIPGMPTSLIFDRQGKLIHQHIGFKTKYRQQYEEAIDKALALSN